MSGFETALVAIVVVWMMVLTVTVLVLVRQMAVVMLRFEQGAGAAPVDDGLEPGTPVPDSVLPHLTVDPERPAFALVLAGVCQPCREVAAGMDAMPDAASVTAIVSGRDESAVDELVSHLPATVSVLRGDEADQAVQDLAVSTTPFVFEVRDGRIAAKAAIRGADHLIQYVGEAETVRTSELKRSLEASHAT